VVKHSLIFIHGMGPGSPLKSYEKLWKKIAINYERSRQLKPGTFDLLFKPVFVNYHDITARAKKDIFDTAFPGLASVGPIRTLRYLVTFYLGDVTAYVSENDNHISSTVWQQIKEATIEGPYSIIGHSLGSVIAFDFLYQLLERDRLFLPKPDSATPESQQEIEEFAINKVRVQNNFRNLFTLGSMIGLFMMRAGNLWTGEAGFGEVINPIRQLGESQICRSWLNFYDKEDVLAYPLENLFDLNPNNIYRTIEDVEIQTGNLVYNSHTNYWPNDKMAAKIAAALMYVIT
jgi:hypothetical protein